ncbi:hypothetical protein MMC25_002212 [Agyrium rufum]|nr:hypothetical protein [Agyrium rufum]
MTSESSHFDLPPINPEDQAHNTVPGNMSSENEVTQGQFDAGLNEAGMDFQLPELNMDFRLPESDLDFLQSVRQHHPTGLTQVIDNPAHTSVVPIGDGFDSCNWTNFGGGDTTLPPIRTYKYPDPDVVEDLNPYPITQKLSPKYAQSSVELLQGPLGLGMPKRPLPQNLTINPKFLMFNLDEPIDLTSEGSPTAEDLALSPPLEPTSKFAYDPTLFTASGADEFEKTVVRRPGVSPLPQLILQVPPEFPPRTLEMNALKQTHIDGDDLELFGPLTPLHFDDEELTTSNPVGKTLGSSRPVIGTCIERYRPDPNKPWVKQAPVKGKSHRTTDILAFKPKEVYSPLPAAPTPWDCFNYTKDGELELTRRYTAMEITRFIFDRPSHVGELTLYIQRLPPDSARRYPHPFSSKCRFNECPAYNNTINQAQIRVAFSEAHPRPALDTPMVGEHDPMLNAGYVHLYCLEQLLDFPALCRSANVKVDRRVLPLEPRGINRMQLGTVEEQDCAQEFIDICSMNFTPAEYPRRLVFRELPYENTLLHKLVLHKLGNSHFLARRRNRLRKGDDADAASTLEKHLGNLKVEAEARLLTRLSMRKGGLQKRKRFDDSDDEDEQEAKSSRGPGKATKVSHDRPRRRGLQKRKRGTGPDDEDEQEAMTSRKAGKAAKRR